jgi:hypothetical protein
MICPYCGKENPDNLTFCNYCGGSLMDNAEKQIPENPPLESGDKSDEYIPETTTPEPAENVERQISESLSAEPTVNAIQTSPEPQVFDTALIQPPQKPPGGIYGNKFWWYAGCFILGFLILFCGIGAWGVFRIVDVLDFLNASNSSPTIIPTSSARKIPTVTPSLSSNLSTLPTLTITTNPLGSTPGLLFYDDFSDPNSGWDRVDETDFLTDYYNNAYRIIEYSDMSDSWANPDNNLFGDVIIEVDATKHGGPDDNDFGVICRYQSSNQFYYAIISSDGYYGITKVTSASSDTLGRDELGYSDSINQGFSTNHIRFDCIEDVLTLYVNGNQIDQQTDTEYTSGNVGLLAGAYDIPGTDILFDNFFVFQP